MIRHLLFSDERKEVFESFIGFSDKMNVGPRLVKCLINSKDFNQETFVEGSLLLGQELSQCFLFLLLTEFGKEMIDQISNYDCL